MHGRRISLMMSFMALGTFMTAQELPLQGDFSTIGGNSLPVNWEQDKGENCQPLGKVEVIDETIEKPIKAVRLPSGAKPTIVHTVQPYPVQGGDCVLVRLFFKGTGVAEVGYYGYYGYDASRPEAAASDRHSFKTYSEDWDCRSRVFEIGDPKITAIRICFSTPAGTTMSFANITARKLSKEEATLFSSTTNHKLWERRIQGVNLATGKKVSFDPPPNYELTAKGNTDATDLTDGKLGKPNDMLWFDPEAVAWYNAFNGATIIVDLGEVQPVKKAVIRVNGGKLKGITFPQQHELERVSGMGAGRLPERLQTGRREGCWRA